MSVLLWAGLVLEGGASRHHCQSERMCTKDIGNTPFLSGCPSMCPICRNKHGKHNIICFLSTEKLLKMQNKETHKKSSTLHINQEATLWRQQVDPQGLGVARSCSLLLLLQGTLTHPPLLVLLSRHDDDLAL